MLVASLAEAWIEIIGQDAPAHDLPVASLAEAWIEIPMMYRNAHRKYGRLPHGGVD